MALFRSHPLDPEIRRLALPALGALVAEPLFLLTDTALVGHLGAEALGGLSIASAIIQTALGLLIFLAYTTTPAVARSLGAGDRSGAIGFGIAGLWLAVLLGAGLVFLGVLIGPWTVALFGAAPGVEDAATTYFAIALWGLPAMLITFAATGLLRGLQDTRTPLVIAGVGFVANALLNALFIYSFGWGIAGSAIGTVLASWGMAAAYLAIVAREAGRSHAPLAPTLRGLRIAASAGTWLLLRTASLRVAMLATIVVATALGTLGLAVVQIALTIFATVAFVLDALAIAGQALVGKLLGAEDGDGARMLSRRLVELGILFGAIIGVLVAALSPFLGWIFTSDPAIASALTVVLLVLAAGIPLSGLVFVLDGVLIGAGDVKYLAWTGAVNLAVYLPLLAVVGMSGLSGTAAAVALWVAFGFGYIGARAVTLSLRARGARWVVTGALPLT